MKYSIFLLAVTSLLMASCNKPFKKAEGGLQYKIISEGKGKTLQNGNFFEVQIIQSYKGPGKDTVLFDSRNVANQILALDSTAIPPVYFKIFLQARKGDSIVTKQLTDSAVKGGAMPPFMKKGGNLIASYKIVNIFETKASADSAYKLQLDIARGKDSIKAIEQIKKDDKVITEYLAKNKIQAVKAPGGTYVEMIAPGNGPLIDTSVSVQVFYTGKTLTGKQFDSNMDTTGGRPKTPLLVTMGQDPSRGLTVIKGWTDGLSLLNKGAKAKFYVPSSLGYGPQAQGPDLGANEILVFDIEVVNTLNREQAIVENDKARKQMMAEREAAMQAQMQSQAQQPKTP